MKNTLFSIGKKTEESGSEAEVRRGSAFRSLGLKWDEKSGEVKRGLILRIYGDEKLCMGDESVCEHCNLVAVHG